MCASPQTISPPRGPRSFLVRGQRGDVGVRHRALVLAAGDQAGDVRHVDQQLGADLARDRGEGREVELARVGRGAGHEHLRAHFERFRSDRIHVEPLGGAVDAVGMELVEDAGEVLGMTMRQVPAVIERHRQHLVVRLAQRHQRRDVGLRAAVRLHVGVRRAEEALGALTRQLLDRVDVLAAAVVALARVALRVFVGEPTPALADRPGTWFSEAISSTAPLGARPRPGWRSKLRGPASGATLNTFAA